MSGLYIEGFELPKEEVGAFKVAVIYRDYDFNLCVRTGDANLNGFFVPDHGRLIDADAATAKCEGPTIYDLTDVPEFLSYEPTILPAERERS